MAKRARREVEAQIRFVADDEDGCEMVFATAHPRGSGGLDVTIRVKIPGSNGTVECEQSLNAAEERQLYEWLARRVRDAGMS